MPEKPLHRQYEALRAYFVEKLPSDVVAERFGYTPGSFRVLCHQFRHLLELGDRFFKDVEHGPHAAPKRDPIRELVISLRKKNLSVYDIQRELAERGVEISANTLTILLREEGFAKLPRRLDEERPFLDRPVIAPVADHRMLDLSCRQFRTAFAGLFLFIPLLMEIDLQSIIDSVQLPGSDMIPAAHAVRSLLALKILGKERTSHVMEMIFDPGIALFAGLNVVPKRSFLSEYSERVDPRTNFLLMGNWNEAVQRIGFSPGSSFDLDFHSIPANSEAEPLDKHYVSSRSRSQKGILAFLARDADENVICYGNAGVPKPEMSDEILRFTDYWKEQDRRLPQGTGLRLPAHHLPESAETHGSRDLVHHAAPAHQEDDRRPFYRSGAGMAAGNPAGADQAVPEPPCPGEQDPSAGLRGRTAPDRHHRTGARGADHPDHQSA